MPADRDFTAVLAENDRFVFRIADPVTEGTELFRFLAAGYQRDFRFEEFAWYKTCHPLGKTRPYVAQEKDSGRFVASISMQTFLYRAGEVVGPMSLAVSGVTHPDYRRLGLFVAVNRLIPTAEARLGIPFGIGFPNAAALPGHLKAGWKAPAELRFVEKTRFRRTPSSAARIVRFDESFDELYREASETYDLVSVKDRRILNWRYVERPAAEYHCFALTVPRLTGLVVLKRFSSGSIRKAHIVDFLALNDDAADELISTAERFAEGSDLLNLWMPVGSRHEAVFFRRGFEPTSERQAVIVRSHQGAPIPQLTEVWLTLGDNDVY
jgi:hypothetical protein